MSRKSKKRVKKFAKKHPILTFIIVVILLALIGCCVLHTAGVVHIPFLDSILSTENTNGASSGNGNKPNKPADSVDSQGGAFTETDITEIKGSDLSIHFLMLGNEYTGDSILIKSGDTEVLIDAGSRQSSAGAIVSYVQEYCTDGVLEYVIATHADQDHIAGFVGNSGKPLRTGVLYQYSVETLIQFPLTNKSELTASGNSSLYGEYVTAVEYAKEQGTAVYTALQCYNNENGGARTYTLGDGVTMQFLYQRYYEETTSDENDYSVCMLLTQGENNYLFTGDLETKGEASLVENNDLPQCVLYKGGHHGSPTSSTEALLSVIQPQIVCVCCCCGSDEYTDNVANMFPSQAFVDRVAPYTDKVYVTTIVADNDEGYESLNGNIVVWSDGSEVTVRGSNNDTLFKDTEWFKNNRLLPPSWE